VNWSQVTHRNIVWVMVGGFALVILLLLTAGFFGIRNIRSIRQNAVSLIREQTVANGLIDKLQSQQVALTAVFHTLARDPDSVDADQILAQLDETDRNIGDIAAAGLQTPERDLWLELRQASAAFSGEARSVLAIEEPETFASRDLFRHHEEVVSVIARLIGASYQRAIAAQRQINSRSRTLMKDSLILMGTCLILALLFSVLTVRMTARLFRQMEWQTGELSRVSWHMLENQESTARRFSHELHDELGQSLTAVKANLMALNGDHPQQQARVEDCVRLVEEAIGNVRQLSQLLRPTILDDFGLEAGLRWLCEGFTGRTGIEVEFAGTLDQRLPDETETHLFRIAQEALTNVARHSGATRVRVDIRSAADQIVLSIRDNGRGLPADGHARPPSLGMIGMRARARSAGGDMSVTTAQGTGVSIEVRVPAAGSRNETKNPGVPG
jgi:signal transduction histidine kinase